MSKYVRLLNFPDFLFLLAADIADCLAKLLALLNDAVDDVSTLLPQYVLRRLFSFLRLYETSRHSPDTFCLFLCSALAVFISYFFVNVVV